VNWSDEEKRIIRVFTDARATTRVNAKTAEELGIQNDAAIAPMLQRGLIRTAGADDNKLWVPLYSADLFMSPGTRRTLLIAVGLVALIELAMILYRESLR
jgi:hypothetical protein